MKRTLCEKLGHKLKKSFYKMKLVWVCSICNCIIEDGKDE